MKKFRNWLKHNKKKSIAAALLIVIIVIYIIVRANAKPTDQLITVKRGSVTQVVSVTGNTKPIQNVDLAFVAGGKIARVYVDVGSRVQAGQALASLDSAQLSAQLASAEANVQTQQAKLADLQAGPRPEDVQIKQTQLASAQQTLSNFYQGVPDILNDAYAKANDAVRQQANPLFVNPDTLNPQLSFKTTDSQAEIDADTQRYAAGQELDTWKSQLVLLSPASSQDDIDQALQTAKAHLNVLRTFLNRTNDALLGQINLSSTTAATYKADLTTALGEVNGDLATVNGQTQNIATQKIAVQTAQSQLELTQAGNTPQAIAAQQAQVAQAQASAQQIRAQLAQTTLSAPFSGVITVADAKVGQIAVGGTPLISMIADSKFTIEAQVPEADIGKITVGDPVEITLDAFPGENFTGTVTYIDPGETVTGGVVNFKVDIAFDKNDARMKSGLTSNLDIETITKTDVLVLPQVAILENDEGTFVEQRVDKNTVKQIPVTVGVRAKDGTVEVVSGVTEGEQVLNIGAK